MKRKQNINIEDSVNKNYHESLNNFVSATKKTYESFINNSALQSLLKDASAINEMVKKAAESLHPTFKNLEVQKELIETIRSRNSYFMHAPITPRQKEKIFTKQEVED